MQTLWLIREMRTELNDRSLGTAFFAEPVIVKPIVEFLRMGQYMLPKYITQEHDIHVCDR